MHPLLPRLSGLAACAVLLLAGGATSAGAETTNPKPTLEARRLGVEPGNAPMGWRNAKLSSTLPRPAATFTPPGVLGMDVASYQGNVAWTTWANRDKQFVYVKATESTTYRNPYFRSQFDGSAKAGLVRGAYHFANPARNGGRAQASFFVRHGGAWRNDGKTLPGALDIEYNPYGATCYGKTQAQMVAWIADFVTTYKQLTGRDAAIYSTAGWWSQCTGNTTRFSRTNLLWIARWSTSVGTLPGEWPSYTFWQYTDTPLDQDQFSGSYARLLDLAANR